MRRNVFWVLAALALALRQVNPIFGGLIWAGGFAEWMVAKRREVW